MRPRCVWLVLMLGAIFLLGTGVMGLGEVKKQGSSAKNPSPHPALPTVAIVATGGTIAERYDPQTGGAVPALSGDELIKAVPQLQKVAHLKVVEFSNIDSSHMTPEIWARLSRTVDKLLDDPKIVGAVVTHGTDTMAEGAYFLDLTLKTKKPVVFTGAMRDASDPSPDGPANLLNAVTQVCSPNAQNWGVTVTLNNYINAARDVRKTNTTNVQTFESGEKGYLGYIALGKVFRFNDRLYRQTLPLPEKLPKVALIWDYAGSDGSMIRQAVEEGAEGLVVVAVGAGNVNPQMFEAIQSALKKGVAVVISSRVYYGSVLPIYGDVGGGATLKKAGAILGGNLTPPKARLLLMLALPVVKKDHQKLADYFWPKGLPG